VGRCQADKLAGVFETVKLPLLILEEKVSEAMRQVCGLGDCAAIVRPATDPQFGDYQANGVMPLAKRTKANPRELAEEVLERLRLGDICESVEVAGPGFINFRLKAEFVASRLLQVYQDSKDRLGIEATAKPERVVVDFSGPNIAKQMHVGHLRSTIIGDCISRLLEFLGHKVIRQNHIGDWGKNFGMVILGLWHICMSEKRIDEKAYYQNELEELKNSPKDVRRLNDILNRHEEDWREDSDEELGDGKKFFKPFLEKLEDRDKDDIWPKTLLAYQFVNLLEVTVTDMGLRIPTRKKDQLDKEDANQFNYELIPYESLSRHITAYYLQNIDDKENEQEKKAWERSRKNSLEYWNEIYDRLGITFDEDTEIRGESFYKDMLSGIVEKLKRLTETRMSDGALCVFPAGFKNKEGQRLPLIVQKSDGAYLYATTDLAALRFRVKELNADRIIYVTDARQSLHFRMVFAVADMAGWTKKNGHKAELVHVTFGSVMGEDGKPLKTRSGENVKLKGLLDEAVERAKKIVEEKNPKLDDKRKQEIAKAVGIGAVKYADFSNNRTSDYIFSFDKMLSMDGNTAPYMQYAYARIKSIERKGQSRDINVDGEINELKELNLTEADEIELAKYLIRYGEAIDAAASDYRPNYLTAYLYELSQKFSSFYTNCPVLDAGPDKRPSRLLLCRMTSMTIRHGLSELLGINVVEQM